MREPQIAFELPTDLRSPGRLRDLARGQVVAELPPFLVDLICALALHRALGANAQPIALRELRRTLPGAPSEKSLVTEAYELTVYDFTFALATVGAPARQAITVDHLQGLALPAPEHLRLHLNTRYNIRRRQGTRAARTDMARVLDDLAVVDRLVNDGEVNEAARVLRAEHLSPNLLARTVPAKKRRRTLGDPLFVRANEGMQRGDYAGAVKEATRSARLYLGDKHWRGVLHAGLVELAALRSLGNFAALLACRARLDDLLSSTSLPHADRATAASVLVMPTVICGAPEEAEREIAKREGVTAEGSPTDAATIALYRAQAAIAARAWTSAEHALRMATEILDGTEVPAWLRGRIHLRTLELQAHADHDPESYALSFGACWRHHATLGISFPLRYLTELRRTLPERTRRVVAWDRVVRAHCATSNNRRSKDAVDTPPTPRHHQTTIGETAREHPDSSTKARLRGPPKHLRTHDREASGAKATANQAQESAKQARNGRR